MRIGAQTLLLLGVLWTSLGGSTGSSAEITGKIADPADNPVPSLAVELRRANDSAVIATTHTNQSGTFQFRGISTGEYQFTFRASGFRTLTITKAVSDGDRVVLPVMVLHLAEIENCPDQWDTPKIALKVIGRGTELVGKAEIRGGTALRDASVLLESHDGTYESVCGTAGSFRFSNVKPGRYTLRVVHDGFAEFVIDGLEIQDQRRTEILDTLVVSWCPTGVACQPIRKLLRPHVCGL